MDQIGALVLAGGKSSRMGREKMNLPYKNKTFITHMLTKLEDFEEVLISINTQQSYTHSNIKIITDKYESIGPIGGIYSALSSAESNKLWIGACDMPHISKELITYTCSLADGNYDAYIIRTGDGKVSPMGSVYSKSALPKMRELIDKGCYKLMTLINQLKVKYIDLQYTIFDSTYELDNINTQLDYERLNHIKVIAVSGIKNSGKTTLVCKLVERLAKEGIRVGTIKHDGHEFQADVPGTDSYRHKRAGAEITVIFDKEKYSLVRPIAKEGIEELLPHFEEVDLIILEGFKYSPYSKIEVVRKEVGENPICDPKTVLAYATDNEWESSGINGIPAFSLEDVEGLIGVIKAYIPFKNQERV